MNSQPVRGGSDGNELNVFRHFTAYKMMMIVIVMMMTTMMMITMKMISAHSVWRRPAGTCSLASSRHVLPTYVGVAIFKQM